MPIRVAKHGDLAAIMDVEQASFPPLDQWSCASWQADLDAPDRHVIVVDVDRHGAGATDEASAHDGAGSCLVAVATFHAVADTCDLDRIMVTPQQRRRGLAGALLDDGLGWARSQGCTRILLEVRDDNTTAQQLYRRRPDHGSLAHIPLAHASCAALLAHHPASSAATAGRQAPTAGERRTSTARVLRDITSGRADRHERT